MDSKSARMSSAAEAKFRIDAPNSQPRAVKVIALDAAERAHRQGIGAVAMAARHVPDRVGLLRRAARRASASRWTAGSTISPAAPRTWSTKSIPPISWSWWRRAGENAAAAAIIGEACSVKHVMTTALILGGASSSDETLSKMLAQLRPHVMMLVISSADEYIKDMLTALRA